MNKYTNAIRTKDLSEFARVEPSFDGTLATFSAKTATPNIGGVVVPMVHGKVRLAVPTPVANPCDPSACGPVVTEAIAVDFNVQRGGENLAALRDEVVRLVDLAIADYQFANGLVPPTDADFGESE